MANGLRKLIRRAQKDLTKTNLISRTRLNRFQAEVLEDRIAPAVIPLTADDFITWDVTVPGNDGGWDATDGWLGVGVGTTAGVTVQTADPGFVDGGVGAADTLTGGSLDLTIADAAGAVAKTIIIGSNQPIGTLDLSGLNAGTPNLTLWIGAGLAATGNDGANPDQDFTIDGTAYTCDNQVATPAAVGDPAILNAGENFTALAGSGITAIDFGATDFTGMVVEIHIATHATGTIGTITSNDVNVTLSDNAAECDITSTQLGAFTWAGPITLGNNGGLDINLPGDAGTGIASFEVGGLVTVGGTGGFDIDCDGIAGALTFTSGVTISGAGNFNIDADITGAIDDGIVGAVTFGPVALSSTGDFMLDGGDSGFTTTIDFGTITSSGAGDADVTVQTAAAFGGKVTTGAITNGGTGDADISFLPTGATGFAGGFEATGLILVGAAGAGASSDGTITIGTATGALNNVTLDGVTANSTVATGIVNFLGLTIGDIVSSADLETGVDATNTPVAGNVASDINFTAEDGMGTVTVDGNIISDDGAGGNGAAISFEGDNNNDGTGNIGNTNVTANIGSGDDDVNFTAVNIGTVDAVKIGDGGGPVNFTADDPANDNDTASGNGAIGTIGNVGSAGTLVSIAEGAGGVTFAADDGTGTFVTTGSMAAGGAFTVNANQDTNDDMGAAGTFTAATNIGTTGANTLTINTNGGAADNTAAANRTVGAITAGQGFARVNVTSDGDVGLMTVQGGQDTVGNDLEVVVQADVGNANHTNPIDVAGFNVVNTDNTGGAGDSITITALTEISGTLGTFVAGDTWNAGVEQDFILLNGNMIIYNGDDVADTIDANYRATVAYQLEFTTGQMQNAVAQTILAATLSASPVFTAVLNGETFEVDFENANNVSATLTFLPGGAGDNTITIDDITFDPAATAAQLAEVELVVTTTEGTEFDCGGISLATAADGTSIELIRVEGDLGGNIGQPAPAPQFGDLEVIIIEGNAGGNTFFGTGLAGLGTGGGSVLNLGPNVTINALERAHDDPLLLTVSSDGDNVRDEADDAMVFNFADNTATGAPLNQFNRHVTIVAPDVGAVAAASATLLGIDGLDNGTTVGAGARTDTADATSGQPVYLFTGLENGAGAAPVNAVDPQGLIGDGTADAAMISQIVLANAHGLSTDVAVRETNGSTAGSWLEYETSIGLINLTTQVDSVSVGIDDNGDLADNAMLTGIAATGSDIGIDFDRLGGGEAGGNKVGLNTGGVAISDATAALGQMIVQSMGAPAAANINLVVTGNSGAITMTGDANLLIPDAGFLTVFNNNNAAAIAIGGNLEGDLTVPGGINNVIAADILVGIGLDIDGDGDVADAGELGGDINGVITLADAPGTDILVYGDANNDIVITGADIDPENPGLELNGDLNGVKAGPATGELGNDADDDILVAGDLDYAIGDGGLNADLFVGGNGGNVLVEGTGITGSAVIGGSAGAGVVTIINHALYGDTGDTEVITPTVGNLTAQWGAGGVTTDTLGDIYLFAAAETALTITSPTGDPVTVGDIFVLDIQGAALAIASPGNIGTVVAADDATMPTSDALLNGVSTDYEVVYAPTALDTASGDDGPDLNFLGNIDVENCDGLIAEGFIQTNGVGIQAGTAFGYLVALNGDINAAVGGVHANTAIGHIVASEHIWGDFVSEGTLAVGTAAALNDDLLTFGLAGVPAWFTGGILAESGDIGIPATVAIDASFSAVNATVIGGIVVPNGDALGTFYVPAGDMEADVDATGNAGGVQMHTGTYTGSFSIYGAIAAMIVPQNAAIAGYDMGTAAIEAMAGAVVVSAGSAFSEANVGVTIDNAGLAIVTNVDADDTTIERIQVINLAAGTTLGVDGDVMQVDVVADFGGTIDVDGVEADQTEGQMTTLNVGGDVLVGAALQVDNFDVVNVEGTNNAVTRSTDPGEAPLTGTDSMTFVNQAGENQTLYINGSPGVTANWEMMFGKLMIVELSGIGLTSVTSVNANLAAVNIADRLELNAVAQAARLNRPNDILRGTSDIMADGTAHVGTIATADDSSSLMLLNTIVDGDAEDIDLNGLVFNLWVGGDADNVSVMRQIFGGTISGNVGRISSSMLMNTTIGGNVGAVSAGQLFGNTVEGAAGVVNVSNHAFNNVFGGGVGVWNVGGFSVNNAI